MLPHQTWWLLAGRTAKLTTRVTDLPIFKQTSKITNVVTQTFTLFNTLGSAHTVSFSGQVIQAGQYVVTEVAPNENRITLKQVYLTLTTGGNVSVYRLSAGGNTWHIPAITQTSQLTTKTVGRLTLKSTFVVVGLNTTILTA